MNCSIELSEQKFEDEWWFMGNTTLWYRGNAEPPGHGTAAADRHTFRLIANKCFPFVETGWGTDPTEIIPSLSRLSREYNAALPTMRRSWVLPDGAGVLWLGYGGNKAGVWFPYRPSDVPEGVEAAGILDGRSADGQALAHRTYRVSAENLLEAFGLRSPPQRDPRLDWTYKPMQYTWPDWASTPAEK